MNGSIVNAFYNTRAPILAKYLPIDEKLHDYTSQQFYESYLLVRYEFICYSLLSTLLSRTIGT